MEDYATPFIALVDREPADLSADDRESLEYYYASVNIAEGLPADTTPRRWCLMAQNLTRVTHMVGRLPVQGDPGASTGILRWTDLQQFGVLNSYQRARLRALPGGCALVRGGR